MILIILFAITLSLLARRIARGLTNTTPGDVRLAIVFGFFFGAIAGGMCAGLVGYNLPRQINVYESRLISLRGVDGFQGNFFVASGNIGSKPVYFFYRDLGDGNYRQERLFADENVIIREESRTNAVFETTMQSMRVNRYTWLYALDPSGHIQSKTTVYRFIIPSGTLKKTFSLM